MKSKIIILGDSPLVTGFRLSGVSDFIVSEPSNFQNNLESLLENKDYGIIIVSQSMLGIIDWKLKKKLDSLAYPVIVPVAGAIGDPAGEAEELRYLIKRALGFDISKK